MIIGALKVSLALHGNRSLKEKRRLVRSVKDKLKSRFNVSVAEVDDHDVHQRATLGVTVVAVDAAHADSQLQSVASLIGELANISAIETELIRR